MKRLDKYLTHYLIHTGQNYDFELNEVFFNEMGVRKPDYFLDVVGETLAQTVGNVIAKSDEVLEKEAPDAILILGDTNSALAAYPAKRRKIPIFHMEAGNRCFDFRVPEEINRRIVDHISDINLPYTEHARRYLLLQVGKGSADAVGERDEAVHRGRDSNADRCGCHQLDEPRVRRRSAGRRDSRHRALSIGWRYASRRHYGRAPAPASRRLEPQHGRRFRFLGLRGGGGDGTAHARQSGGPDALHPRAAAAILARYADGVLEYRLRHPRADRRRGNGPAV